MTDSIFEARLLTVISTLFPSPGWFIVSADQANPSEPLTHFKSMNSDGESSDVAEEEYYENLTGYCKEGTKDIFFGNIEVQAKYINDSAKLNCSPGYFKEVVDTRIGECAGVIESLMRANLQKDQIERVDLASEGVKSVRGILLGGESGVSLEGLVKAYVITRRALHSGDSYICGKCPKPAQSEEEKEDIKSPHPYRLNVTAPYVAPYQQTGKPATTASPPEKGKQQKSRKGLFLSCFLGAKNA